MSHPTEPAYPAAVTRYGVAGQLTYDAHVHALVAINVPEDEARADVLALWPTIVLAEQLQPIPAQ